MNQASSKIFIAVTLILIVFIAYGVYQYTNLKDSSQAEIKNKSESISNLESDLTSHKEMLENSRQDNIQLSEALDTEKRRNEDFEDQIRSLSKTVGVLDKLSKTDPELLQKYSKVYFLNENYAPNKLKKIDDTYILQDGKNYQVHADVWPHLKDMLEEAEDDGINLIVISAYRSFFEQASLKSGYKVSYGSGANTFSADQGYSEHQLGTTIDLSTKELGTSYTSIEDSDAYKWLQDNAYKYGFILSYPKGNAYYQFEPWHWRYVGIKLAKYLDREEKNFYDLTQREIDSYLVDLF
jgi:LAS superfamily LD-carboxypeptidase LdcB